MVTFDSLDYRKKEGLYRLTILEQVSNTNKEYVCKEKTTIKKFKYRITADLWLRLYLLRKIIGFHKILYTCDRI